MSSKLFSWSNCVICENCLHMFDFQNDPASITFPNKDLSVVHAKCIYCFEEYDYTPDKWLSVYDAKDVIIEEQKKSISSLEAQLKTCKEENTKFAEALSQYKKQEDQQPPPPKKDFRATV